MAKMTAVQIPEAGGNFEVVEREIPKAAEAYERMITNKARFRVVLTMQ